MPCPPVPVRNATLGKKSGGSTIPAKYISFHDVATNQFVVLFLQILCLVKKKKTQTKSKTKNPKQKQK